LWGSVTPHACSKTCVTSPLQSKPVSGDLPPSWYRAPSVSTACAVGAADLTLSALGPTAIAGKEEKAAPANNAHRNSSLCSIMAGAWWFCITGRRPAAWCVHLLAAHDMKLIRLALSAVLASVALESAAQYALEIIPLRHTTVDQVLPTLRPLLEPGGTLTGQQSQLIVRASPGNVAEIRRALEAIDRPSRRLQILVRFDDSAQAARQGIEASGRIGNRGRDVDVRARDSRASREERIDQRVQALEGSRAYISTGQSRPAMQRQRIQTPAGVVTQDTFVTQEAITGFEVVPRVSGDRVFLDIAPQRQSFDAQGGVQGQRMTTSASGRLGEWFELGALVASSSRDERGLAGSRSRSSSESRRVWVKVEEIGN
jgi:hypothetical protein